jgi:hypothetical protein
MTDRRRERVPRKQLVSIRLDGADVERVRRMARRLKTRESDVFRFALALAFSRLAALGEGNARGTDLLPVLFELGPELVRHFNLDVTRLAEIVNAGASDGQAIEPGDIELLATRAMPGAYLHARLHGLVGRLGDQDAMTQLREYFYRKYFNPENSGDPVSAMPEPVAMAVRFPE